MSAKIFHGKLISRPVSPCTAGTTRVNSGNTLGVLMKQNKGLRPFPHTEGVYKSPGVKTFPIIVPHFTQSSTDRIIYGFVFWTYNKILVAKSV